MANDEIQKLRYTGNRASLDTRGIIGEDGRLEIGNTEPALSMNPDRLGSVRLPMEGMVHQGLMKAMQTAIEYLAKTAEDVSRIDADSSKSIYEAIANVSEGMSKFSDPRIVNAISTRDIQRSNAFGEYWRDKSRPVSRY